MNNKLTIAYNKTLKLNNNLRLEISKEELENFHLVVNKMDNYLIVNGAKSVGPLVQYVSVDKTGEESNLSIILMRQSNNYLNNVTFPYHMDSIHRVKNCMYCRFVGPEDKLNFAYDKIQLVAYEEGIELKGSSYTVYVDSQEDTIIADVFMERADT